MTSTLASFRLISSRLQAWTAATAHRPDVTAEARAYLERIETIGSIGDFLKDDRTYRFAMTAFGLQDMIYAKAFMRKVLQEGVDSDTAFANRLADPRYREFATTFDFARYGDAATIFDRTRQGTVDRFIRQSLEQTAGAQNENVRLALYFQRKAPELTGPFDVLADRALTKVVYTALGLPASTSAADVDKQAALIAEKLDIASLKDPDMLDRFITRFAAVADAQTGSAATSANTLLSVGSRQLGVGIDLLMAAQNVKSKSGDS